MKKRCLLILFLLHGFVNAQPYFSKMYDLFGGWEAANNLLHYDSVSKNLILSGTSIDFNATDSTKYRRACIWTIDSFGVYSIKSIYGAAPNNMIGFLPLKTNNSIILKAETQQSDSSYTYNSLYYMNLDGDTIKSLIVDYPKRFNSTEYILKNNLIYSFGTDVIIKPWPFAALCFDTTGKQLWYKVYNNKRVYPTGATITTDGHFLVGGVESVSDGGFKDSTFAWFAKIDTIGNIIWQKRIENKLRLPVINVHVISINNKYYWFSGGSGSQKDLEIKSFADLTVTNQNGDVLHYTKTIQGITSKEYSMSTFIGYPVYKNGFFYGVGQAQDTMSHVRYNDYIQFCKLDTLGNIKWRRTFSQWYMSNRPYSLTAIPDGFIICADGKDTTHTTGYTDAWIIKTDTNGCIIPGCHLLDGITEVVDPKNYVKVYPNPASTQITILFDDPKQTKIDYIELFDEIGSSLLTQQVNNQTYTLNTNHLPNGMYYLAAYFGGNKRVVKKVLVHH